MTQKRSSVRYEDIENTPAAELLQLSYSTLSDLIREARRRVNHAETTAAWLEGIKIEKYFRRISSHNQTGENFND